MCIRCEKDMNDFGVTEIGYKELVYNGISTNLALELWIERETDDIYKLKTYFINANCEPFESIETEIHYCPFCGKKLNEKGEA